MQKVHKRDTVPPVGRWGRLGADAAPAAGVRGTAGRTENPGMTAPENSTPAAPPLPLGKYALLAEAAAKTS